MIQEDELPLYREVQSKAKAVLAELGEIAKPGMTEADVASLSADLFLAKGVTDTWYYNVLAFVLAGDRSVISLSGRDYVASESTPLNEGDLLTVDVSPSVDGRWGDCARSFCVGLPEPSGVIKEGLEVEYELHNKLLSWATPDLSFHDLYEHMNSRIVSLGFENLDFSKNLGHSIEKQRSDRRYIEAGNRTLLGSVSLFTFEPHIRRPGSLIGVKHENIYYFNKTGQLLEL